ncbi:MAG TPA: TIGR02300 family protein [Thermoanaerobaculia bacterium]|nr:TIGR02300 family protein [Thermoanaerobaculia bacterium]
MANLGRKHSCYSCQTKFYDLGKAQAICPRCGADQKNAEDAVKTSSRSRRVVEVVPIEEVLDSEVESVEPEDDVVAEEGETEQVAEDDDDDDDEE